MKKLNASFVYRALALFFWILILPNQAFAADLLVTVPEPDIMMLYVIGAATFALVYRKKGK